MPDGGIEQAVVVGELDVAREGPNCAQHVPDAACSAPAAGECMATQRGAAVTQ